MLGWPCVSRYALCLGYVFSRGFVTGDAARRRSMAPSSHVHLHRLGSNDAFPLPIAAGHDSHDGAAWQARPRPGGCPSQARRGGAPLVPSGAPPATSWQGAAGHQFRQHLTPNQEQSIATGDMDVDGLTG